MNQENNPVITNRMLINYAHGMLPPAHAAHVKKALEKDEALRWEYEGILRLMQDYPDKDPEEVLDEMVAEPREEAVAPLEVPKPGKTVWVWKRLAVAAGIVLLAVAGFFLKTQNERQSPEWLAANVVAQPYEDYPDVRGGDGKDTSTLWIEDFKQAIYDTVVRHLQQKDSLTHAEQFFLGLAYLKMASPQAAKAETALKAATASGREYQSDAWLYLGIAQLLQQKKSEAVESFSRSNHPQAKDFLERLRK